MNSGIPLRTPPHSKTLGIEIEGYMLNRPVRGDCVGFFYVTTDGSITCPSWNFSDVEFVSQPMPVKMLKKQIYKLYSKHPWEQNQTCGIHIHASRKWVSPQMAKRIRAFVDSLMHDDFRAVFGRMPNNYCRQHESEYSRYSTVNTTNLHTVEFRMFASGSAAWAAYCVSMVEYLINNNKHLNADATFAASDVWKSFYKL